MSKFNRTDDYVLKREFYNENNIKERGYEYAHIEEIDVKTFNDKQFVDTGLTTHQDKIINLSLEKQKEILEDLLFIKSITNKSVDC